MFKNCSFKKTATLKKFKMIVNAPMYPLRKKKSKKYSKSPEFFVLPCSYFLAMANFLLSVFCC